MPGSPEAVSSTEDSSPDWDTQCRTLVFFTVVLPVTYYVYWRVANRRVLQLASKIAGPPGLPLFGNLLEFRGSPTEIFDNLISISFEYLDVVKLWLGPRLLVFLTHPADLEVLLSSHEHIDKSFEYDFMRPWLGDGLLTSSGKKWYSHRKVIAQCFHVNILRSFMDRFNKNAIKTIEILETELGKEFDVREYMCKFTADTLLDTVMGMDKVNERVNTPEYSAATTRMSALVHLRHTKLYFRPDLIFNRSKYGFEQKKILSLIHNVSMKILKIRQGQKDSTLKMNDQVFNNFKIEEKLPLSHEISTGISYGQSSGLKDDLDFEVMGKKKKGPLLDTLIEKEANKEIFNEKDILDQIDTLMFEGHDTVAGVTSMFLCLMAVNPDHQAKCMEELNTIFGSSDRDVTFEDTLEMKYLERCIMETMRLYSPVPVIARNLKKELKLASKDVTLPVGTTVIVGIFKLHRREDLYPNPEKFNPENFSQERTTSRNYYSFIPFSAGPRGCVGRKYAILALKTILSTTLRKYLITTSSPEDSWKLQADITLKRTDGFKIKLELREK